MMKSLRSRNGRHLNAEEMDGLLYAPETAAAEVTEHVQRCAACASEVAAMRDALGLFREAMTGTAEAAVRRWEPVAPALLWKGDKRGGKVFRPVPGYFALAATVALVAVLIPLERPVRRPVAATVVETVAPGAASPATQDSDNVLLEEIDQQVSESVPTALEPLEYPADASDVAGKISAGASTGAVKRN
jgi:hypothetical protein